MLKVDETSFANHVESVESIDLHQNLLKTFDLGYLSHMHHLKFLDMSRESCRHMWLVVVIPRFIIVTEPQQLPN